MSHPSTKTMVTMPPDVNLVLNNVGIPVMMERIEKENVKFDIPHLYSSFTQSL
jgi:hypothetical protein